MLAAQHLEEAMVGVLSARSEIALISHRAATPDDLAEIDALWGELFRYTAGKLRRRLGLEGQLGEETAQAVEARDLLAHHYLRAHELDLNSESKRTGMAARLEVAVERFGALRTSHRLHEIPAFEKPETLGAARRAPLPQPLTSPTETSGAPELSLVPG